MPTTNWYECGVLRRWQIVLGVVAVLGLVAAVPAASAGAGAGGARLSILMATSTGGLALARLAGVVVAGLPGLVGRSGPRRDQFLGMAGAFFLGAIWLLFSNLPRKSSGSLNSSWSRESQ